MKSAFLFSIFKYVGALYLIYLGISALWSMRKKPDAQDEAPTSSYKHKSPFLQGFLTNLLNPKAAVFFLTFLPQFVKPGEATSWQFLALGLTYTVLTVIWFFFYVHFINWIRAWMKKPATPFRPECPYHSKTSVPLYEGPEVFSASETTLMERRWFCYRTPGRDPPDASRRHVPVRSARLDGPAA